MQAEELVRDLPPPVCMPYMSGTTIFKVKGDDRNEIKAGSDGWILLSFILYPLSFKISFLLALIAF